MPAPSDIVQFMRGQLLQTPAPITTDFAGKTVVVTGANSGLGLECAKQLVQLNVSTLILACRSLSKGEAAKQTLLSTFPPSPKLPLPDIRVWHLDMTSYASVRTFAQRVEAELPHLHALLVNAGISTNIFHLAENLEETLTVNVTSTFLLALLCLPILQRTAKSTGKPTHLSITGSNVHAFADPRALVTAPTGQIFASLSRQEEAEMNGRYFLSKLLVMLCVRELAQHTPSEVIVNCPSPGWCKTPLFRQDDGGWVGRNMLKVMGRTAEVGARCLTAALTAGRETHGEYLSEERVKRSSVWVRSEEGGRVQKEVWRELVEILEKVSPGISKGL